MSTFEARFPSAASSVRPARHAIVKFAEPWFEPGVLHEIAVAVGEALANAAEHGHRTDGWIAVAGWCDGQTMIVEIKDDGPGFAHVEADGQRPPPPGAHRGYGIFVMRELMDGIDYAEGGTCIRITKAVANAGARAGGELDQREA